MKGFQSLVTHHTAFLLLAVSVFLGTAPIVTFANTKLTPAQEEKEKRSRPVPPPTVTSKAGLRAKTEDDIARAKFFDVYGDEPLVPGTSVVTAPGLPAPSLPPGAARPLYPDFLRDLVCTSDAVVAGRAHQERVLLNSRETYLFTDYRIDVDRWIYPSAHGAPTIRVSRPGGEVIIGRRLTSVGSGQPLEPGTQYLLFLQHIPRSGSLAPMRAPLSEGAALRSVVRDRILPHELEESSVVFTTLLDDLEQAGEACQEGPSR